MSGLPWRTVLIGLVITGTDEGAVALALEGMENLVVPNGMMAALALAPVQPERPLSSILRERLDRIAMAVERLAPSPSVPAARNAILERAGTEGADLVVLLDDSLALTRSFLKDALSVMAQYEVPVVVGRARLRARPDLPAWARHSRSLALAEPELRFGPGGEARLLVLDRAAVAATGVRFRASYARAGLSGRAFLAELDRNGLAILHCGAATAQTALAVERLTLAAEARAIRRDLALKVDLERRARGLLSTAWRRLPVAAGKSLCGWGLRLLAPLFGNRARLAARRMTSAFPATLSGLAGLLPRRAHGLAEE